MEVMMPANPDHNPAASTMVGAEVKRIRLKVGMSQADLARALRLSDDRPVRAWEQDERNVTGPASIVLEMIDAGLWPRPAAAPTYHDLHITGPKMERTSIFNLPFRIQVICTRVAGWEVWSMAETPYPERLLFGEYETGGLRLDVAGVVICDTLEQTPFADKH
jgi:DNA-binding transcriptional regulator YiaG